MYVIAVCTNLRNLERCGRNWISAENSQISTQYYPTALTPLITSTHLPKSNSRYSFGIYSPLAIHITLILRSYCNPCSNFGVMRKYWEVCS